MRLTRSMPLCALAWVLASIVGGTAAATTRVQSLAERIERLAESDPLRAVGLIDAAAPPAERRSLSVAMLEVSGRVYADLRRDADVAATLADLESLAAQGDRSAEAARYYVRAYALYATGRHAAAAAEIDGVDIEALQAPAERYRWSMLQGAILRAQGQPAAAVAVLQRALQSAQRLEDDVGRVHAGLALAAADAAAGDLDQADEQAQAAAALATSLGDETLLASVDGVLAELAVRRADGAAEGRLRVSAVAHAGAAQSDKWQGVTLAQLGGAYFRAGDFRQSLKYLKAAAPRVARTGTAAEQSLLSLKEGLTLIALGNVKQGGEQAEQAIAEALGNGDPTAARDMLREYAATLQRAGYLMMAIGVQQRAAGLSDQLLSEARAATATMSAAGNAAGPGRQVGTETAGAAPAAFALPPQRGRRSLVVALVLGIAAAGGAGVWTVVGVRRAGARARSAGDRDSLTGVLNRQYFNEQILPAAEARAMNGCVLLADLDHLKRINDTWGHAAGDAVLRGVGERLAAVLRDGDTLVRWEGDTFLCVLDAVTAEQANRTAERLLEAVRHAPIRWQGHAIDCSLSIGHACFPLVGAAAEVSLAAAISLVDKALVEAKRRGRDRACLISAVRGRAPAATDAVPRSDATDAERTIELTEMGAAA